ncbi:MAG TPA: queuosine salvage family protein, partial [Alphaproteobacteria bacterium]|nr:queuosine salvage family protein [Alphaproteobacteria bacterium]
VADYDGLPVPIFKRAQILAADMHLALGGRGAADFTDLAALTIFADNMVPHVLRYDGILAYAAPLAAAIDAGEILKAGSAFEVELRAVAIHAVECLKSAAHAQGKNVTSLDLDRIIWNRGYEQAYFAKLPHRTMTVWY